MKEGRKERISTVLRKDLQMDRRGTRYLSRQNQAGSLQEPESLCRKAEKVKENQEDLLRHCQFDFFCTHQDLKHQSQGPLCFRALQILRDEKEGRKRACKNTVMIKGPVLEVQSTAVAQDQEEKNGDLEGGRETENTARFWRTDS